MSMDAPGLVHTASLYYAALLTQESNPPAQLLHLLRHTDDSHRLFSTLRLFGTWIS